MWIQPAPSYLSNTGTVIPYFWTIPTGSKGCFAELLMPVLDELCAEHGITTEDVGARILRTFERLRAEG